MNKKATTEGKPEVINSAVDSAKSAILKRNFLSNNLLSDRKYNGINGTMYPTVTPIKPIAGAVNMYVSAIKKDALLPVFKFLRKRYINVPDSVVRII